MLEGDRFEVLDITTSPSSEYVGLRFREMPIRGAVIGAIVRDGNAVFPRSDDVLLAGDRVIVFTEVVARLGRREGPVTPGSRPAAGAPPPAARRSTSGPLSGSCGTLLRYLSLSSLLPTAIARRVRGAVLALPRRGCDRRGRRPRARTARRASCRRRLTRGISRRRADVAARGRVRGAPLPLLRRPAARSAGRRILRGDVGIHDDRSVGRHRTSTRSTRACSCGASSRSGSEGWGSSCSRSPCCRGFGSAAASCSSRRCRAPRSISSRTGSARRLGGCGSSTSLSRPSWRRS